MNVRKDDGLVLGWLSELSTEDREAIVSVAESRGPLGVDLVGRQRALLEVRELRRMTDLPADVLLEIAEHVKEAGPWPSSRRLLALRGVQIKWADVLDGVRPLWSHLRLFGDRQGSDGGTTRPRAAGEDDLRDAACASGARGPTTSLVADGSSQQVFRLLGYYIKAPTRAASMQAVDLPLEEETVERVWQAFGPQVELLRLSKGINLLQILRPRGDFTKLRSITIEKTSLVVPRSLGRAVLARTPNLEILKLNDVFNLRLDDLGGSGRWTLDQLREMHLDRILTVTGPMSLRNLLERCPRIETVKLQSCAGVQLVHRDVDGTTLVRLPTLKRLFLNDNSGSLQRNGGPRQAMCPMELDAPDLVELQVNYSEERPGGLLGPTGTVTNLEKVERLIFKAIVPLQHSSLIGLCQGLAWMQNLVELRLINAWGEDDGQGEARLLDALTVQRSPDGEASPCPRLEVLQLWVVNDRGVVELEKLRVMVESRALAKERGIPVRRMTQLNLYLADDQKRTRKFRKFIQAISRWVEVEVER